MAGYKLMDSSGKPLGFVFPHQDILVSMTEALKDQQLTAYIDLVEHLKNMSILAFEEKDFLSLERIDEVKATFKKHINSVSVEKIDNSSIYNIQDVNSEYYKNADLKIMCEFRFAGVIERICIAALRKTILKDQVPEAQTRIFYKPERDIELTVRGFNDYLEEKGFKPLEGV